MSQVTKYVLGGRKWKPVVKKFCARLRWFLDLHSHSYWSICRHILLDKICLFEVPLELISCMGESCKKLQQQENVLRGSRNHYFA